MFLNILLVILFISFLIIIHELAHFLSAKAFKVKVEEFGFGFPPRVWGKKIGETEYSVNAIPFGGFVKIFGEHGGAGDPRSFSSQKIWKKSIMIGAGVMANFLFAWIIGTIVLASGSPKSLIVSMVQENSPASLAGLKTGDKIINLSSADSSIKEPDAPAFIEFIDRRKGNPISVTILRFGESVTLANIIPRINPPAGEGAIGVGLLETGAPPMPLGASVIQSLKRNILIAREIIQSLSRLVARAPFEPELLKNIVGPVGVVSIAAQAGSVGFIYFLELISLISLNLTVLNIIPFPALDGGRLILLAVEKVKGSPLPQRVEAAINSFGFAVLIIVMLIVSAGDIIRLF